MNDPRLILLDTHIWLWLMSGASKAVSPRLRALVDELTPHAGVRVSAITLWEIGMLVSKNRIVFDGDAKEHVYRALRELHIGIEDITAEIAMNGALLVGDIHGDPADRILISTAKNISATLITHDKNILSYSKKHGFPALSI